MNYRDSIHQAMLMLAQDEQVIFIGQSINHQGNLMSRTLEGVAEEKRIEVPLIEDAQMGMSTGLALEGYVPISIYPRFDFLLLATNQLVNQLDKVAEMSCGIFKPKVIIRTAVGSRHPVDAGLQHTQDHSDGFRAMLRNTDVVTLRAVGEVVGAYRQALESDRSTLLVEYYELYNF